MTRLEALEKTLKLVEKYRDEKKWKTNSWDVFVNHNVPRKLYNSCYICEVSSSCVDCPVFHCKRYIDKIEKGIFGPTIKKLQREIEKEVGK